MSFIYKDENGTYVLNFGDIKKLFPLSKITRGIGWAGLILFWMVYFLWLPYTMVAWLGTVLNTILFAVDLLHEKFDKVEYKDFFWWWHRIGLGIMFILQLGYLLIFILWVASL